MAGLVHSIEELVGRTPLMELDRFERQQRLCTQRCRWAADRRIRERTSWSSSRTTA